MFEELRDAKLAWSVSDENKTNKQNTASMFEMRSIEGGEGCLSSLSRMDRMQSPLKTYEEDEEFSESMNEHNSPGLNVFPKTKSKKSPPDFRPPKNKIQNCFSLTKTHSLNITHVVDMQIKKHAGALNHRRSTLLRYLLKELKLKG